MVGSSIRGLFCIPFCLFNVNMRQKNLFDRCSCVLRGLSMSRGTFKKKKTVKNAFFLFHCMSYFLSLF